MVLTNGLVHLVVVMINASGQVGASQSAKAMPLEICQRAMLPMAEQLGSQAEAVQVHVFCVEVKGK